ncbi:symplekin isoform X1 [Olea europaea subsp. europaea]|uniref:Symplekin isoform X1 n=2 Tax=Olea europaea subsp. europaea TaxID=158383 RepID=A0A8S0RTT0_OLEEU|nr:symplekin isoform X1 [Olea europaea subsp. europaea]
MAGPAQEQALPLLASANNHGDLAVKLSSLKQVKDILLSAEPSHAAELFPYLVELQTSPEMLVRKYLLEVIDEIGAKSMEHLSMLLPILLAFLKDNNFMVAKQSIITGTKIFCRVLEDLSLQFQRRGIVERWLEELWMWMVKFKDSVFSIIFEAGSVGPKLLAIKFLETFILLFTSDTNDSEKVVPEVTTRQGRAFNISMLVDHHPVLDLPALVSDANRYFGTLLDLLRSASNLPGSLTISVVNSLAMIARKRPMYYSSVLPALVDLNVNFEIVKARHTISIQYSIRTAFLGFMRCTHPIIVESRERLLKALRAMNAGDAADQVIRQVDKIMRNSERASRDSRLSKDDQQSDQLPILGDLMKKRSAPMENEDSNTANDATRKRLHYGGPHGVTDSRFDVNDAGQDHINGISPKLPLLDRDLTPVEQMIAMIGALIAEGERGVESLEILISNIHPDLLADIVITNMKHLPKNLPPLASLGNLPLNRQCDSSSPSRGVASNGSISMQTLELAAQIPVSSSSMTSIPSSDMLCSSNLPSDSKRDPRRDPRRLDPRRVVVPVEVPPQSVVEDNTSAIQGHALQSDFDDSSSFSQTPVLPPPLPSSESVSVSPVPKTATDLNLLECSVKLEAGQSTPKVELQDMEDTEIMTDSKGNAASDIPLSTLSKVEDTVAQTSLDATMLDEAYSPSSQEMDDDLSPPISNLEVSEVVSEQLAELPPYVELTVDHQRTVIKLALERIFDSYQNIQETDFKQTQLALLARLFAQIDADTDVVLMMQKRIVSDYQEQKGHELVIHVLYHLHTLMLSELSQNSSSAASVYENFLLGVAKSLLDAFPATDKSFSRLLGEAPYLPESVLRLLDDLCSGSYSGVDGRDGDRVTQGLGIIWSLIFGRPLNRQACLDIALKCAVHSLDDVRARAIRLVANKLYAMSNVAERIEQFSTNKFLLAVEQHASETGLSQSVSYKQRIGQVGSQETSVSGSQISDPGISENDTIKVAEDDSTSDSAISFSQSQQLLSLFFALCAKKPSLLQLVFDNYARAPKAVKQAVHRHTPVLIRALGSSYSELLQIISDPPQGSELLLTQVLHLLSEGKTPPPDLVATVKRLYDTKLKDASILIPILSSFSRDEVLPIFPSLVNLPLDKFQTALAHILQGSAHSGPALTPAEVLVAIHDIIPERDGLPLKKITDACSACFEQRTVFTQQVLAKALNQMVDQTPLPLLFMRTVIQAIDAFPTLVDFVMEILSKLVNKQVWRMPKLWVGFLKCISQTQPHSFSVLLQLPSPQLESALNKYSNLRGPLSAFVNQSSVRSSLPRSTLLLLGITT